MIVFSCMNSLGRIARELFIVVSSGFIVLCVNILIVTSRGDILVYNVSLLVLLFISLPAVVCVRYLILDCQSDSPDIHRMLSCAMVMFMCFELLIFASLFTLTFEPAPKLPISDVVDDSMDLDGSKFIVYTSSPNNNLSDSNVQYSKELTTITNSYVLYALLANSLLMLATISASYYHSLKENVMSTSLVTVNESEEVVVSSTDNKASKSSSKSKEDSKDKPRWEGKYTPSSISDSISRLSYCNYVSCYATVTEGNDGNPNSLHIDNCSVTCTRPGCPKRLAGFISSPSSLSTFIETSYQKYSERLDKNTRSN